MNWPLWRRRARHPIRWWRVRHERVFDLPLLQPRIHPARPVELTRADRDWLHEQRQRPVWRPVTRHCSNCLRHTETDRVPEQRLNGYTIPAYTVCTYCGHSYGFEETA